MPRPKPQPNSHCATCDAPLYRSPSKLQKHKHHYCDQKCRDHHTIVWIGFVYANYETMTVKQIAAHIGIPPATFRTWVFHYNKCGLKIAFKPGPVPVDGIGCRERARRKREAEKLERQSIAQERPAPVAKERKPKPPKVVKEKINVHPSNHGKPPAKDPAVYKTKTVQFDPRIHKMVQVGPRTWKQIPKDNQKRSA